MTVCSLMLASFLVVVSSALSLSLNSIKSSMAVQSGLKLRPYDPKSESDRLSLEEICANEFGGADYLPKMASTYAADDACLLLALAMTDASPEENGEGKIVAIANYKRLPAQGSAWIEAVRTHPDHRNRGLASALLRCIVDLCREENLESPSNLLTCTIQSNKGMLRALAKEGFALCNSIEIVRFAKLQKLPGWASTCEKQPRSLLDGLDLRHLVTRDAKSIASSTWNAISTERQLVGMLAKSKMEGGTCGYLPGLYEYIVPGPNRIDLKQSLDQGLVLGIDCDANGGVDSGKIGSVILALTRDERITSLKSKWVCSIVAHTQLGFEAAVWHAHSQDIAERMQADRPGDVDANTSLTARKGTVTPLPFCLVFDDAVPLTPGSLAHALPRTEDKCVVFSYKGGEK